MKRRNLWLVGGDERQAILAGLLAEDGHRVQVYGMERHLCCEPGLDGIGQADCVIFPLPAVDGKGNLHMPLSQREVPAGEVLARLCAGQQLLAGKGTPWLRAMAESRGLVYGDYFEREELALRNAIPTAEGAIRIAMEALPVTLHGTRVLILGFGRLGMALGPRLCGLGAQVTVAARRQEQRAMAAVLNLAAEPVEGLKEWIHSYDLVINTVPAVVLGVEELAAMKEGAVVIELASLPGGVDGESASALGVKVIRAPGLPGKEAPLTAARCLRDTVYSMMESMV